MLKEFNEIVNGRGQKIYLKTNDKVRCDKHTYSYEEADKMKQIAWWVHDDYVVIDVDSKIHASILYNIIKAKEIKCHIFRSIKGAHFVFREKPGFPIPQVQGLYGVCGIKFDTRTTDKGYIVLPHKQSDRKWVHLCKDKLDVLPMWLYPQKKVTSIYTDKIVNEDSGKKEKIDIMPLWYEMGDSDGRNDKLFRYFTVILKNSINLTINEKREGVRILNEFVLKESLPDSEIEATVLREDLTEGLKNDEIDHGQELDPDIIANKIILDEDVITKNDIMFIYNDGYYKPISENEMHYLIHHKYDKRAKDFKRNEIVKFIKVKTNIRDEVVDKDAMMLNVNNGRINLQTKEHEEHTEAAYDTIRVPFNFNEEAKPSQTLKSFLRFISNGEKKKLTLLYEMIGLCLVKRPIIEVMFILVGEQGANGKSTFLDIVENLLGQENVSNIDLGEIGTDEYAGFELYSKLANIGDDLKLSALKDTGNIKTLISGKSINAKVKFKARFKFKNFATQIFAANRIPITYDKTGGFYRRFVIIRFNKSVPPGERDPFLIDKITSEDYEFLLHKAIDAVADVIEKNELTRLQESDEELEQYKTENSSILVFLQEGGLGQDEIHGHGVRELYTLYKEYCEDTGYKQLQKGIFDAEIKQLFGVLKRTTTAGTKVNKMRWMRTHE